MNDDARRRVGDLIATMTVPERIAQLSSAARVPEAPWLFDPDGRFDRDEFEKRHPDGVGILTRPSHRLPVAESVRFTNDVQATAASATRHTIGVLFAEEGVHGHMAIGATVYPVAIALASSWDIDLMERIGTAIAREVRARGSNYVYAPVLDLALDPRWGRVEETFGEDPYLVSRLGCAAVRGLQGSTWEIPADRVLVCVKHFAGHGAPEAGMNGAPLDIGERSMREQHLVPFEAVIRETKPGAVMAAYHEIDGVPCHANRWLLTDVLRDEWGFTGVVSSDGYGIPQLTTVHHIASDDAEAARLAVEAGVDLEVPETRTFTTLEGQVASGALSTADIDRALRRVLLAKARIGLLDPVTPADPKAAERIVNHPDHRTLALEAALRSMVLLANGPGVLPLDATDLQTVAVIGPNAADAHLGGYTENPGRSVSLLDGLRARLPHHDVPFAEGCRITEGPQGSAAWWADEVILSDPSDQDERMAAAVSVAQSADVAILAIGGNEGTAREGWWYDHSGDRDSLDLPGRQLDLLEAVDTTGTPMIAVVFGGRPLALGRVVELCDAVLQVWYPGQEGGTALAAILLGDVAPSGKLPMTFPRSVGQIPSYRRRKPSADRGYLFTTHEPLFPFGHGLTYTTFEYGTPEVVPSMISPDDRAEVRVPITNTGRRSGTEVAQLYVTDRTATVTRPERSLQAFERVDLKAGQTTTIAFTLAPRNLALVNQQMEWIVEPGVFDVYVGGSSSASATATLEVRPQTPDRESAVP